MTDRQNSGNAFEPDKAGTEARTRAERTIETLRQGGGVFVEAVRATRMAMALTDPTLPGNPIVFANQAFLDLTGYHRDEVLGQQPYFMNRRATDAGDAAKFRDLLAADRDGVVETVQYRKDGSRFVATVLLSAFKDETGHTLHHFLSWADVTRRVDAEDEAAELRKIQVALRHSEERLRDVLDSMAEGFVLFAPDFTILDVNAETSRLAGRTREELIGRSHWEAFPGMEPSAIGELFKRVMRDRVPGSLEHRYERPDGRSLWVEARAFPNPDGRIACFWRDITARKTAEEALRQTQERQEVLVAELQHRTRNLMSVVQSTAEWTGRTSTDFGQFLDRFRTRLDALARVQALLSRLGDSDRISFDELIRNELVAMNGTGNRVTLDGPSGIRLRSGVVQTLAMALHELATNAVKYGALGQPDGRLTIAWRMLPADRGEHPRLHIEWREHGVRMPAAGSAAQGGGRGRELIEQALPYQLSAETSFELGADGVRCTITLPVSDTNTPA